VQLETFLHLEPNAHAVAEELDWLRAVHASMVDTATSVDAHVRAMVTKASAARDRGAFDDAHAALRDALRVDPTSGAAAEMLDEILVRQLEARVNQERLRMRDQRQALGAPLVAAAHAAMERGYVDVALQSALAAERVAPHTDGLTLLIDDLRRELAADDQEAFSLAPAPLPDPEATAEPRGEKAGDRAFSWADLFRRKRKA
jgi:hypothetical protein